MDKKFCIVVFSHADTEDKKILLRSCLISLSYLKLPIILSSHVPVDENLINLTTHTIESNHNLILNESEIISNPVDIESKIFQITDIFAGFQFYTSVFKKTYGPAVLNHYIKSVDFIKKLGYTDFILWEYDSILGYESHFALLNMIDEYSKQFNEYLGFACNINGILSFFSIPSIYNVQALYKFLPECPVNNPKVYNDIIKMKFMEQWMYDSLNSNCVGTLYGLENYQKWFPDTKRDIYNNSKNILFFSLRSGIYFDRESHKSIFFASNSDEEHLIVSVSIKSNDDNMILFEKTFDLGIYKFNYLILGDTIDRYFSTEKGFRVKEEVKNLTKKEDYKFEYDITKNNIDFCKKIKSFKKIKQND